MQRRNGKESTKMRRPTRERLQEIREAPYKSLEEFDLFAEIDGLTHDLTMLDSGLRRSYC